MISVSTKKNELMMCFLENGFIENMNSIKNEQKNSLNREPSLDDISCLSSKKYGETLGKKVFRSKRILSLIHALKKRNHKSSLSNKMAYRVVEDSNTPDTSFSLIEGSDNKDVEIINTNALERYLENNYVEIENGVSKSTKNIKASPMTPSITASITIPENTSMPSSTVSAGVTPIVIGTVFTTTLSEPTTTVSKETFSPIRHYSNSRSNTYTVIGVSTIVIFIVIITIILIIFGVKRSLRRQEAFEDMLYRNEMNAHAKLVAEASTPVSEKVRSGSPSSFSTSVPFMDQQYSGGRFSRAEYFHDPNKTYSVHNTPKVDDQNSSDLSAKHYYSNQKMANGWHPMQHMGQSMYYNHLGHPVRSFSMSSRPKDYIRSRYLSQSASIFDNPFQSDQLRSVNYNDSNSNVTGVIPNQSKLSCFGYPQEQSKGGFTQTQIKSKPFDSCMTNRFSNYLVPHNSQAFYTTKSNTFSLNHINYNHTPLSAQTENVSFDTANTHFSDISNTLSSPLSAYQNSGTFSSEQDSSFTVDLTPPKSLHVKENTKVDPELDLGIEKIFKTNKNILKQNSIRTPSINASVDIWAEKKKKLLDLTNNLTEFSNNSTNTTMRMNHNI
ncbi:hypothetical protein PMAC_002690 [Pneumocystis sp. 'macacae']|nr:hypothetical protein PMAC_002690 [Pneumocystis sp. 'macacae']